MPSPISGGAEVWLGYYQSLRATQAGLTLNVDMSAMAFVRSMPMVRNPLDDVTDGVRVVAIASCSSAGARVGGFDSTKAFGYW